MRTDFYYQSKGGGQLHGCRWSPDGAPKAIIQIVHGIAEHVERYDEFARYMNWLGYQVVAEDHMGHGKSITEQSPQGYFNGGWFAAVDDTCQLMVDTMAEYPGVPYILFGHSMGSFMTRTILARYPENGISAAVICGTGWMPRTVLAGNRLIFDLTGRRIGEKNPSEKLYDTILSMYNKKVEHRRTKFDWLSRDKRIVDAYIADPLCGFTPSVGLLREMMTGVLYIQNGEHLKKMRKDLPVYFIAGGDDPVGSYGTGVELAAAAFKRYGMKQVSKRIYPLCRHEILNEMHRLDIYDDVNQWIESVI